MDNPFVLAPTDYKRDINPVRHYCEQAALFLSKMTGKDKDYCYQFVSQGIKSGKINLVDPKVKYLHRDMQTCDREEKEKSLLSYLNESIRDKDLIAPTLTTYIAPDKKPSLYVGFVDQNVQTRGRAKKEEFAAKAAGNKQLALFKNSEQTNVKLTNNAFSGGFVSNGTILMNKTAHSTLTSTCRSTSGYGNANNEKMVSGNRHYWSPETVINNILSIVDNTDLEEIQKVCTKYSLKYPTVQDAFNCIKYSADLYWFSPKNDIRILALLEKLTPVERAAFVYVGDMYQLRMLNDEFVRTFITKLSSKITGEIDDALGIVKKMYGDYVNLAHHICFDEAKGKGKDYEAIKDRIELKTIALTSLNIQNTLFEYRDLIKAFWVTPNVPASVAHFPTSIRRSALVSDTDSTIFTVQDWVQWYQKNEVFGEHTISVGATMIFLASQSITHVLAMMSANFGIEQKRIHQIAMKNEFFFDVFVPTSVGKHYYAMMTVQEGNVFKEYEMEIKGVHLKNSNVPKQINKQAKEMMERILTTIRSGKKIKILDYLKEVSTLQKHIQEEIYKGKFLRLAEVKTPDSYKNVEVSPYVYHLLWKDVFSPKYGYELVPPYPCITLSTNLENASMTRQWISNIKDEDLKNRLVNWMTKTQKDKLTTLYVPLDLVTSKGIPEELKSCINTRGMVANMTKVFMLVLETLGFFLKEDEMVCDFY